MDEKQLTIGGKTVPASDVIAALRRQERATTVRVIRQIQDDFRRHDGASAGLVAVELAYRSRILGYLTRHAFPGDEATALEVWNDTLLRVYLRINDYDADRSKFLTWIYYQARYAAADVRRKLARRKDELLSLVPDALDADPLTRLEQRALSDALKRLTDLERTLLVLRIVHGLGNVEIARGRLAGEVPEEHVRVYVARALERFGRYYREALEEEES